MNKPTFSTHQFFVQSLDLLCIANTEGYFVALNPAFSEVLGFSEAEMLSKSFVEFIHPDDVAPTLAEVEKLAQGIPTISFENRYRCKDGSYRWFAWRSAPSDEGLLYANARDITEQKLAEQALARSEQRYRALFENTSDLILITSPEGQVRYANAAWREAMACADVDVEGLHIRDFVLPEHMEVFEATTAPDSLTDKVEMSFITTEGRRIEVEGSISRAQRTDGSTSIQGIFRDISKRKEIDRMKNEFVSVVSHELRTPLTSIRGSLGLLEGGVCGDLPTQAQEMVRIARSNTDRLVRLINDILDLEKIEAGKMELNRTVLSVEDIIALAYDGLQGVASQASVTLTHELVPAHVFGDQDRLVQIVTNLTSNAIKFSPKGGEVTIRSLPIEPGRVRISVTDQGPGIPEEAQRRIFGRFQQLDASDSRSKGGTGLGLAISKALVEQHEGHIAVESAPNQGSTFYFEVPRSTRGGPRGHNALKTLLIVEDDQNMARYLQVLFKNEGLDSRIAPTLSDAIIALHDALPDLIILDIGLPDGSGLDLIDRIARLRQNGDRIPIIVLSGLDPNDARVGLPIVLDWVAKPFDKDRLMRSIHRSLTKVSTPKVALIDDDPSTRAILRAMIEPLGIECLEVEDGAQAVQLIRREHPDLIILDVAMPGLDGFDVVTLLRRGPSKTTPLLVYTGKDLSEDERKSLTLGITRHITKARTSETEFIHTVRSLLQGGAGKVS